MDAAEAQPVDHAAALDAEHLGDALGLWPPVSIIRANASNSSSGSIAFCVTFSATVIAVAAAVSSGRARHRTLVRIVQPFASVSFTRCTSAARRRPPAMTPHALPVFWTMSGFRSPSVAIDAARTGMSSAS